MAMNMAELSSAITSACYSLMVKISEMNVSNTSDWRRTLKHDDLTQFGLTTPSALTNAGRSRMAAFFRVGRVSVSHSGHN